jgi:WhiB family redox-sensing transcriptional regulator
MSHVVRTTGEAGVWRFRMEWVHRARCKDEDPELFFPVGTTGPAAAQIDSAKAVCAGCDVRLQCLEWALSTGQDAGVWGGTSEEERRSIRRARRRQTASTQHVAAVG